MASFTPEFLGKPKQHDDVPVGVFQEPISEPISMMQDDQADEKKEHMPRCLCICCGTFKVVQPLQRQEDDQKTKTQHKENRMEQFEAPVDIQMTKKEKKKSKK